MGAIGQSRGIPIPANRKESSNHTPDPCAFEGKQYETLHLTPDHRYHERHVRRNLKGHQGGKNNYRRT
jgi:hypothetical protein